MTNTKQRLETLENLVYGTPTPGDESPPQSVRKIALEARLTAMDAKSIAIEAHKLATGAGNANKTLYELTQGLNKTLSSGIEVSIKEPTPTWDRESLVDAVTGAKRWITPDTPQTLPDGTILNPNPGPWFPGTHYEDWIAAHKSFEDRNLFTPLRDPAESEFVEALRGVDKHDIPAGIYRIAYTDTMIVFTDVGPHSPTGIQRKVYKITRASKLKSKSHWEITQAKVDELTASLNEAIRERNMARAEVSVKELKIRELELLAARRLRTMERQEKTIDRRAETLNKFREQRNVARLAYQDLQSSVREMRAARIRQVLHAAGKRTDEVPNQSDWRDWIRDFRTEYPSLAMAMETLFANDRKIEARLES